jgi:hypothetical protein
MIPYHTSCKLIQRSHMKIAIKGSRRVTLRGRWIMIKKVVMKDEII